MLGAGWARGRCGHGVQAVGLLGATFGGAAILGSVIAAAYGPRLPRYLVYVVAFLLAGVPRFVALALDWHLAVNSRSPSSAGSRRDS